MKINTLYKNERVSRKELKHASIFMLAHLIEEKEHDRVKLLVESRPIKAKRGGVLLGITYPDIFDRFKFKIILNPKFSRKKQLLTLAHEIVHVKQFIRGELGDTFNEGGISLTKWKGKLIDESNEDYFDLPWEIEASGREYGLWKRWDNYLKNNKIKYCIKKEGQ